MADIHALGGTKRGSTIHKLYVFHFKVPASDQIANVAKDPLLTTFKSAVPDIDQSELDAIRAGQVVEVVVTLSHHVSETDSSIKARTLARYKKEAKEALNKYGKEYHQYLTRMNAS